MAWKIFLAGVILTGVVSANTLYVEDIAETAVDNKLEPVNDKLDLIIERQWEHLKGHP